MRFGYLTPNNAAGIRPDTLAAELEQRGFDSIWTPEHSHIPTGRQSPYGDSGPPLADAYLHMMDPFVSLMAAASATTTLRLCTGVCLILEHDLLDLAVTAATLDVLSGGRLTLGIGVGWNVEELANHRPELPFGRRYSAMAERVDALRTAWRDERARYDGSHVRFTESWVYPKPAQGLIPIAVGSAGPIGMAHAATLADEWCPLNTMLRNDEGRFDPAAAIGRFRDRLAETGREPSSVPISVHAIRRPRPGELDTLAELGVQRVVLFPEEMSLHDADETRRQLDDVAPLLEQYAGS